MAAAAATVQGGCSAGKLRNGGSQEQRDGGKSRRELRGHGGRTGKQLTVWENQERGAASVAGSLAASLLHMCAPPPPLCGLPLPCRSPHPTNCRRFITIHLLCDPFKRLPYRLPACCACRLARVTRSTPCPFGLVGCTSCSLLRAGCARESSLWRLA